MTPATCKEQLLYEIHDPAAYLTPDVIADFSRTAVTELARDRVAVDGAGGRPRPGTLKVSLGCRDGFIGEGQISYAGAGALERATLAGADCSRAAGARWRAHRGHPLRSDRHERASRPGLSGDGPAPYEVRLRVAARTSSLATRSKSAMKSRRCTPTGRRVAAAPTKSAREVLSVASTFIPRSVVTSVCTARW